MPKLTNEIRKKIAPFLLIMYRNGLTLQEIRDTLSSVRGGLTRQAIRDILDRYFPEEYNRIIKGRKVKQLKKGLLFEGQKVCGNALLLSLKEKLKL